MLAIDILMLNYNFMKGQKLSIFKGGNCSADYDTVTMQLFSESA